MKEQNYLEKLSSENAEMSTIGSMFQNNQALIYGITQLEKKDFTRSLYSEIFEQIKSSYDKEGRIDRYVIQEELRKRKNGDSNSFEIAIKKSIAFSDPESMENYCKTLKEYTFRREVYIAGNDLQGKALDMSTPEDEIYRSIDAAKESEFRTNPDVARTSTQIKKDNQKEIPQLKTGLHEWDSILYKNGGRGLGTTELVFARPGHGKTFYLFRKEAQLARNGYIGLHFHLEDTDKEASDRIDAVIDPRKYKEINDKILVIDNHRYLHEIVKDVRYYKHKYGIKWFSADHLGRIRVAGFRSNDKVASMIEVSNTLTDLSKDEGLHGMFPVQPNKSYKTRTGWSNLLREEDLKGATEIFEDAFVVTTLMRPNIYPELRVGFQGDAVKSPYNTEVPYDSVFVTQIKNRRQRITGEFIHMVQDGNALLMSSEYNQKYKIPKIDKDIDYDGNQTPF